MITADRLRKMKFFQPFNDSQLEKFAAVASDGQHSKDSNVQAEGGDADALYFVESGKVALRIDMSANKDVVIDTINAGELFGWSVVVPPHRVTASSLCVEDTSVIVIPRDDLLRLMDEDVSLKAGVYEGMCSIIADRLKDTRAQLNFLLGWG